MAEPNWKHQTIWIGDNPDILRGMNSESVGQLSDAEACQTHRTVYSGE